MDVPDHLIAMDGKQIAAALREIADWLDFQQDGAKFRARAYRAGADAIEAAGDLAARIHAGTLTELPGIGDALASTVKELHETGRSRQLEKLRGALPSGLLAIRDASGLSPQKVRALYDALGVNDVGSLQAAIEAHRVRDVKGFSEKSEAKLAAALAKHAGRGAEILRMDALPIADELVAWLAPLRVEVAGALRRGAETVDSIELVAETDDFEAALDRFERFGRVAEPRRREERTSRVTLSNGIKAKLTVAPHAELGTALFIETGSDEHVRAVENNIPTVRAYATEQALYRAAGLRVFAPELREGDALDDWGEDLVTLDDVRGMVHCHTVYSDGKNTVLEMAQAADARGYEYLTFTDHSPTAHYANGVDEDRLKRQWDEIAEAQAHVKCRLLRGTESDITREGALDYPDRVLEQLDVVIASIHSRYQLDRKAMTARVVRAMRQPVFKIWGHALGRMLLDRDPIDLDLDVVLDAIAESRAAIEVNGDPHRIDLPPALVPQARARKIPFVISVDAHSTAALGYIDYGVTAARRGGLRKHEVLNTLPAAQFMKAVRPAA